MRTELSSLMVFSSKLLNCHPRRASPSGDAREGDPTLKSHLPVEVGFPSAYAKGYGGQVRTHSTGEAKGGDGPLTKLTLRSAGNDKRGYSTASNAASTASIGSRTQR